MIYKVYRNLNNGLISIAERSSGLVVAHCDSVTLKSVAFRVSDKGRERVVKEGRKNVHAFAFGYVVDYEGLKSYKGRNLQITLALIDDEELTGSVTYNPFKYRSFVEPRTSKPVFRSKLAKIEKSGRIKIKPIRPN